MNSKVQYYNSCLAARRSIMDLVMMEHFDVSDPVGVASMIESMPSGNIIKIFEKLCTLEESKSKMLLEAMFSEYNSKMTKSNVVNESIWKEQRNNVLLKEENDKNSSSLYQSDLTKAVLYSSVPVAIATLIKEYSKPDGPKNVAQAFSILKRTNLERYNKVRKLFQNTIGHSVLPRVEPHSNLLKGLANAKDKEAADAVKSKWKTEVFGDKKASTMIRWAGKKILAAAGIVVLLYVCHKIYQQYLEKAARVCRSKSGKDKQMCILNFKIQAADAAIKKLEESTPACQNKSNPHKCQLSIQKDIWQWTRRKSQYQEKLQKLSQIQIPNR